MLIWTINNNLFSNYHPFDEVCAFLSIKIWYIELALMKISVLVTISGYIIKRWKSNKKTKRFSVKHAGSQFPGAILTFTRSDVIWKSSPQWWEGRHAFQAQKVSENQKSFNRKKYKSKKNPNKRSPAHYAATCKLLCNSTRIPISAPVNNRPVSFAAIVIHRNSCNNMRQYARPMKIGMTKKRNWEIIWKTPLKDWWGSLIF